MLVFIDESGDPGMKQRQNTSRFFIVTAILFQTPDSADRCDARIKKLRSDMGLHPRPEYHFNSSSNAFREKFLTAVAGEEFYYHALVINKAALWSAGFQNKDSLYKYATKLVFENARPHLREPKIVIDRCGNREFRNELGKYLKRKINADKSVGFPLIKTVKMEASHSNDLLQLADMVCGAIARSFNEERVDGRRFRQIVRRHELRVQIWPRN